MIKYSTNKTVRIIIAILKGHKIRNIVISPGTTNFMLVASLQNDPWFNIKSSADERSAAYIACGWAAESKEPVVLSCTGATASRNYLPALTEAFYRKLPVLAITSINDSAMPGQNTPQVIDRSQLPKDVVKISVSINEVHDDPSARKCILLANQAILELFRHGGGPAHINLTTKMTTDFSTDPLPSPRIIKRLFDSQEFPSIDNFSRIGIFIGSHRPFNEEETKSIEQFCEKYKAVVLCDQTSNYRGKHRFLCAYVGSQEHLQRSQYNLELLIDLGEVSGDYYQLSGDEIWRVSPDGEIRDRFGKLKKVFEMEELQFFNYYNDHGMGNKSNDNYEGALRDLDHEIRKKTPELPFSNIWIASQTAPMIPDNCVIHFGILNTLRAWNFFETPPNVTTFSNVGGFGIDGDVSTLIGASFVHPKKLYFGIVGDLAFFYDMNSIGNRHIGKNIRLMVINNGKGTEFRNYSHPASILGNAADEFVAAGGHYGNKSRSLLKHYAKDLGFDYIAASNKEEFTQKIKDFVSPTISEKSIIMEVFTDSQKESEALYLLRNTIPDNIAKSIVKNTLGEKGYNFLKKTIRGN